MMHRTPATRTRQGAVALFGAMALAACSGSDSTEPSAAEQVAYQYVAAVNAYDIPKVNQLLSSGGRIDGMDDQAISTQLPLWQAQRFSMVNESCNELGATPAGMKVVCTFDFHLLGSEELGLGPHPGNFYEFTVNGQTIAEGSQQNDGTAPNFEVWGPYAIWLQYEHPELTDLVYSDAGLIEIAFDQGDGPLFSADEPPTLEQVAAWEQLIAEFVAAQPVPLETASPE